MKVKFYGTRGSIPVCDPKFQEFGGNTTCVLIQTKNGFGILDAGTGIRELGKDLLDCSMDMCERIYLAFTHFHWDHIQGFPFFLPGYDKRRELVISAIGEGRKLSEIKAILETQMRQEYFPIPLTEMGAKIQFLRKRDHILETEFATVITTKHTHPGSAYSYRIESDGKIVVFCTDVEHVNGLDKRIVKIAQGADLLIHDSQYTPEELKTHKGWGHSSWEQAIHVAEEANVKELILTHHDPDHDDEFLKKMEKQCKDRFKNCMLARDRMSVEI
ncbi:MAG: MBL fold metallo-hydrolase [Bacteroidetes bacterium]|nr:MBL fold metallo-hydrolase [Bacteroidota bacterium]MBU1680249.1 MBL fold metallo-hydrolase [Bacteroidota bacterium]MBU2508462.1 MBL fold metallo-hydrolase [Bacteroidota bacterium]